MKIESVPTTPLTSSDGTKSGRKGSLQDSEGTLSTARSTPVKSVDFEGKEGTPSDAGVLSVPGLCLLYPVFVFGNQFMSR